MNHLTHSFFFKCYLHSLKLLFYIINRVLVKLQALSWYIYYPLLHFNNLQKLQRINLCYAPYMLTKVWLTPLWSILLTKLLKFLDIFLIDNIYSLGLHITSMQKLMQQNWPQTILNDCRINAYIKHAFTIINSLISKILL